MMYVRFVDIHRYGAVEKPKDKFNLYTVSVPSQRSGKRPGQCFIASWDADSFKVKKQANTDTDILSALTVRYIVWKYCCVFSCLCLCCCLFPVKISGAHLCCNKV